MAYFFKYFLKIILAGDLNKKAETVHVYEEFYCKLMG